MTEKSRPEGEQQPNQEQQNLEEILVTIIEAITSGRVVLIEQRLDDGSLIKNQALPIEIGEGYIEIEADGYGLSIKTDKIKSVKIVEDIVTGNID